MAGANKSFVYKLRSFVARCLPQDEEIATMGATGCSTLLHPGGVALASPTSARLPALLGTCLPGAISCIFIYTFLSQ